MREYPDPRIEARQVSAGSRVHLYYREPANGFHPEGWASPDRCLKDMAAAMRLLDAIHGLAGLDAARRRVWVVDRCTCPQ